MNGAVMRKSVGMRQIRRNMKNKNKRRIVHVVRYFDANLNAYCKPERREIEEMIMVFDNIKAAEKAIEDLNSDHGIFNVRLIGMELKSDYIPWRNKLDANLF